MKKALVRFPVAQPTRPAMTLRVRIVSALALLGLLAGLGLLASRPAHTAGGPIPVNVANTPLATTSADSPAKQPVQVQKVMTQPGFNTSFYTVPTGKRLVVEYVNLWSNVPNDTDNYNLIIQANDVYTDFSLTPDGSTYVGTSQKTLLYFEAGSSVTGFFQYNGSNSSPQIYVTLSGYLVNAP